MYLESMGEFVTADIICAHNSVSYAQAGVGVIALLTEHRGSMYIAFDNKNKTVLRLDQ